MDCDTFIAGLLVGIWTTILVTLFQRKLMEWYHD